MHLKNQFKIFASFILVLALFFYLQEKGVLKQLTVSRLVCKNCNVVLISIDTLRADHLGTYGYSQDISPNLDEFAKKSIVFEKAFSASPWTLPSHASLFTSKYPRELGIASPTDILHDEEQTIAEIFKSAGYKTHAISAGGAFVHPKYGFAQGFDDFIKIGSGEKAWNDAERTFSLGENWIKENYSSKFFLFLHTFQVHDPYGDNDLSQETIGIDELLEFAKSAKSPEEINEFREKTIARYDSDISFTDKQIRRIFDQIANLRIENKTMVIITADHGEEFGEHGLIGFHSYSLYDELLHVPLIVYIPEAEPRRISTIVSLVDILPTILDSAGIEVPTALRGQNLTKTISGQENGNGFVIAQTSQEKNRMLELLKPAYEALKKPGALENPRLTLMQLLSTVDSPNTKPQEITMVRSEASKLIIKNGNPAEFYDLTIDTKEQQNQVFSKQYQKNIDTLNSNLENKIAK